MAACGLEARTPGPRSPTGPAQGSGGPPRNVICITRSRGEGVGNEIRLIRVGLHHTFEGRGDKTESPLSLALSLQMCDAYCGVSLPEPVRRPPPRAARPPASWESGHLGRLRAGSPHSWPPVADRPDAGERGAAEECNLHHTFEGRGDKTGNPLTLTLSLRGRGDKTGEALFRRGVVR